MVKNLLPLQAQSRLTMPPEGRRVSRVGSQLPLLPSVLDRLIDHEPGVSTEPAWRQSQNLREFELSVLRDLEQLLNTRQIRPDLQDDSHEVAQSILTYGLPEFSSVGVGSLAEREQLRLAIELTIRRFEPRLREVRVILHDLEHDYDSTLRLTIDALLWVDPTPQPIAFDTVVQPSAGKCLVQAR
jgi:type VI secretion system protein ImpF